MNITKNVTGEATVKAKKEDVKRCSRLKLGTLGSHLFIPPLPHPVKPQGLPLLSVLFCQNFFFAQWQDCDVGGGWLAHLIRLLNLGTFQKS
jgi:hypothetical protein